ncbi:MAG: hypothetical protein JW741_18355 [Sedimentisphaerales bacterium]|nr:hypothetical protein [Sedimentisphaerales bacterium]
MHETVTSEQASKQTDCEDAVLKFKKRMLQWPNPVEYVNNMYGCHPDDGDHDYFNEVFAK